MSGHSKWAKIKRSKGLADAKRGAVFTKLGNQITLAAKQGGGDPTSNFVLRLSVDKAKAENMPKDNIQKAIDRGLGTGKDLIIFENATYEALYDGNVMLMIDTLTDSKNRTVAELKKILEQGGATMGSANSVSWQFDEKGRVNVYLAKIEAPEKYGAASKLVRVKESSDEMMLSMMDIAGVQDVQETEFEFNGTDEVANDGNATYKGLEIYTDKSSLNTVYKAISELGYKVDSAEVVQIAKATVQVSAEKEEKFGNLLESLDEQDDVQNVWTNADGY